MIPALTFALRLWLVGSVPLSVGVVTHQAATRHGVEPPELGGYLVSEHGDDWTPSPEQCGDSGRTCGPFSLSGTWPLAFGYELGDREDPRHAADMAAQLIAYSQLRHEAKCEGFEHTWRAHLKSGPGGRDLQATRNAERRWRRYTKKLL